MTDPKPPRPFPPPLPGSLQGEPFRRVDSAPPLTVDRNAVTPPSGGVPAYQDESPEMAEMRAQVIALKRALTERPPSDPPPTPIPLTRPSQRVRRAQLAKVLGKWTVLLTLLPLVGGIVAKRWPEYSGIVDTVLQLVGLK